MNNIDFNNNKIPIFLLTRDRPYLISHVIERLLRFTDWNLFQLFILDNNSTSANKKIISSYLSKYKEIGIFHNHYNNPSIIQNTAIKKLRRDYYIKIDDDILVTEGWYHGLLNVFSKNIDKKISFATPIIPINGFGWIPFLKVLNKLDEFKIKFPHVKLIQGCTEPSIQHDPQVAEYIWKLCLNLDETRDRFIENQNGIFKHFTVPTQYSIGLIMYSHFFWELMGGWKYTQKIASREKKYNLLKNMSKSFYSNDNLKKKRLKEILNIMLNLNNLFNGDDEYYLCDFALKNNYLQIATTESLVYHFAFNTIDEQLMENIFLDIKF